MPQIRPGWSSGGVVEARSAAEGPAAGTAACGDADGRRCDGEAARYQCTSFVANAAVYGNCFQWHVDADPSTLPPGPWLARYGDYTNGTPGKPLFVSLIVYLDEEWHRDWDAETLFLEPNSGAGLLVQPRPGRAVLMHQDVLHRVSTPSMVARRPRYSLVWKLLLVPRSSHVNCSGDVAVGNCGGRATEAQPCHRETICRS